MIHRLAIAFLLVTSTAWSQQWATVEVVNGISGLINPRIVGGSVMFDVGSKPVSGESAVFKVDETIKSAIVLARKKSEGDSVQLNAASDGTYGFSGSGEFSVAIFASDTAGQLRYIDLPVTLSGSPVNPVDPDETKLTQVSKDSREAMRMWVASMATNYKVLSMDAKTDKYPTVTAASQASNTLDLASRNDFKVKMAKIMQPELGSGALPITASKTFDEIARGFGGVK